MRELSPLVIISSGLESITPLRFFSTKEGLRLGESRGARDPVEALFGHLDLALVIGSVMSLVAIALTFDGVCGERDRGTLSVLLSYPVSRSQVLLAKVLASITVTTLLVFAGIACAAATAGLVGVPTRDASLWFAFALVSAIYVAGFAVLGTAVSSASREPAGAMIAALTIWGGLVIIMPRLLALVSALLFPPSTAVARGLEVDAAVSKLRLEHARELRGAYRRFLQYGGANSERLASEVAAATKTLADARRSLLDRALERTLHEEEERDRWVRVLSVISPASLYQESASELARTGQMQRRLFQRQARLYDDEIGRKLVESRHFLHSGDLDRAGDTASATVVVDNVRPYMIPFHTSWTEQADILRTDAIDALLLATTCILLIIGGWFAFIRMDVRP